MDKEYIISLLNSNKIDEAFKKVKSNIVEPIIDGNNILHIMAIRGSNELVKFIKSNKIEEKIYSQCNERGENILHLAFKNGFDDLGMELLNFDVNLIEFQNHEYHYPTYYVVERINTLEKIIPILIDNGFTDQFNALDEEKSNLIIEIITSITDFSIIKKITPYIDFEQPTIDQILNIAILTKKYVIAEYFIKKKLGINFPNKKGLTPLNALISITDNTNKSYELIKLLLNTPTFNKDQLDRGGIKNEYIPLNQCFNLLVSNPELRLNIEKIILLLLKKIKNFKVIDNYRNTYGIYLADVLYNKKIKLDKKIQKIIFNNSDKDYMNIDGISINSIKHKKIIDKCEVLKSNEIEKIDFPEISRVNHVIFNTDVIHNMLYFTSILERYKDILQIPLGCEKITFPPRVTIDNEIKQNMINMVLIVNNNFCEMLPSLILWYNSKINFIHPKLKSSLKKMFKDNICRYIVIKVSIIKSTTLLHANVILIDKNDLSYRRFEPYGTSVIPDIENLDHTILSMVHAITNKKIKCYRPQDYLELARFQSISNETNIDNKIHGDPVGFCLAWCLWYIEIKVRNPNLNEKELISRASNKIFTEYCDSKSPYNDFIRDYAAMLDKEKNSLLKKFGIQSIDYYKKSFTDEHIKLISEGVNKDLRKNYPSH
jgi:ankyrin repeat protein